LSKVPIDQCDAPTGTTALNYAISASNTTVVRYLLHYGANPKRLDQSGCTPKTRKSSIYTHQKEIINIDECNKSGLIALHIAANASNVTTARHLLAKGADINRRDKEGITPLLVAAKYAKDMEIIYVFFNNKKVDRYCDQLGQNVIAYAEKNIYGLRTKIINRVKENRLRNTRTIQFSETNQV
jgi:ankyrin repeat protein